jgi:restriction endonuclease S subunit
MSDFKYSINPKRLPEGYKHTEVGVIPEDWITETTSNVVESNAPICYGVVQVGRNHDNGIPIIAIKFLKEIVSAPLHRTSAALEKPYARSRVKAGDVLISIKGTIGRVGIVPEGFEGNISRELARLRLNDNFSPQYIAYQLESGLTQERILRSVVGTTRLEFSIATLRQFELPIPPNKEEQRTIAQALSDVDALIAALDKLIAKKRHIKTATMQQLLTGKKRLPGFGEGKGYKKTDIGVIPEDWDLTLLGDMFILKNGFSFKSEYFSSSGPIVLTPGNFKLEGGLYFNDKNTKRYSGEFPTSTIFKKGDLLVVMTDLTPDCNLLGKPAFVDWEETLLHNQRIGKINLTCPNIYKHFLYYFLLSNSYLDKIKEQATGSTVRHTSNKSIYSIFLPIPKKLEEQKAIAKVLSDIDTEITALEKRRTKTQALKQGMMQELLTGRTRLSFDKA